MSLGIDYAVKDLLILFFPAQEKKDTVGLIWRSLELGQPLSSHWRIHPSKHAASELGHS